MGILLLQKHPTMVEGSSPLEDERSVHVVGRVFTTDEGRADQRGEDTGLWHYQACDVTHHSRRCLVSQGNNPLPIFLCTRMLRELEMRQSSIVQACGIVGVMGQQKVEIWKQHDTTQEEQTKLRTDDVV